MSEPRANDFFPVIPVNPKQSFWDETLGTKQKFWIEKEGERWLFKFARDNTGEDWSEKLAYEIANLLQIPAAHIELANYEGHPGTLSLSFIDRERDESLIHGNEILAGVVLGYDPSKRFGQTDHTLENIQEAMGRLFGEERKIPILVTLASYLVLDALIGNTDRHHENWGLMLKGNLTVAPTFDHASSLGRELLDDRIRQILQDKKGVERYVKKGKGAVYRASTGDSRQNPLELVKLGHQRSPHLFNAILKKLKATPLEQILALVDKVPSDRMSSLASQFVKTFLTYTYGQLCNLET